MAAGGLKEKTSIDRSWASVIMCMLIVINVVYLVAFVIPYWAWLGSSENTKQHYGMWQVCRAGKTVPVQGCSTKLHKQGEEWFIAVQAFSTLTFLLLVSALGLTVGYVCSSYLSEKSSAAEAILGLVCASACTLVIAIMIFANKHAVNSLSWSFGLAVTALIFDVVCCIVTFLAIRQS